LHGIRRTKSRTISCEMPLRPQSLRPGKRCSKSRLNPREPGLFSAALHATTGKAALQMAKRDRPQLQDLAPPIGDGLLQPFKAHPHNTQPPLPMGSDRRRRLPGRKAHPCGQPGRTDGNPQQ
jgi:hypothetical protein